MKIVSSRQAFADLFRDKRVGILVFNKDSRNLIRFVSQKLQVCPFEVKYLIDLTLDDRPKINTMALDLINEERIIRRPDQLANTLNKKNIDILLCFERRYGSTYQAGLVANLESCGSVLRADLLDYRGKEGAKAEFNFRWRMEVIDFINWRADEEGIAVVSAFWEDLFPYENPDMKGRVPCSTDFVSVRILDLVEPLYNLKDELRDAKVRFILGSDWGVGKTSFLLEKMKGPGGAFGIAEDAWFALVSDHYVPTGLSTFSAKGYYVSEISKCWTTDKEREIYVKFGGRLEEYVFGIPTDQRLLLDGLPRYFRNSQFDIVLKPEQNWNDSDLSGIMDELKRRHGLTDDRLSFRNMNYEGLEVVP